ncbi:hypothetical protein TorRG33x02_234310, partial [Trema orientale]
MLKLHSGVEKVFISGLEDSSGFWVDGDENVSCVIKDYYAQLFSSYHPDIASIDDVVSKIFHCILPHFHARP